MAPSDHTAVLSSIARAWLPLLLDASIKGALVLLVAWGMTAAMRRASAAARHAVWLSATVGVLLLPALAAFLPGWRVLPGWAVVPDRTPHAAPATPPGAARLAITITNPTARTLPAPTRSLPAPARTWPVVEPEHSAQDHSVPAAHIAAADHSASAAVSAAPADPPRPSFEWPDRWGWLFIVWAFGSLAVLLPSFTGAIALWRLRLGAQRVDDSRWAALAGQLCRELGIRRRVTLLGASGVMPMTWGILRPRLLLPINADQWTAERRRVVLLHELGHVMRWDCLSDWVTRIACAAYWFHPLMWFARHRILAERERACDDLVLRGGENASGYAEHLLAVASAAAGRTVFGAVAMARPSQIESRVRRILDERVSRRTITAAAALACVVAGCVLVLPLAMVRAQDSKRPAPVVKAPTTQPVRSRATTQPASRPGDEPQRTYAFRVIDEHGNPIAGVKLWLEKDFPDWPLCNPDEDRQGITVETKDDGTALVAFPQTKTNVMAIKKGLVSSLTRGATLPTDKPLVIHLRSGQRITGVVKDANNRPIAGAKIRATRQRFTLDYLAEFVLTATTGASGRFEMEHAAEGPYQVLARLDDAPVPLYADPVIVQVPVDRAPAPVEMTAHQGAQIKGRYVSAHNLPLGGRRITVFCRLPQSSIWETTTEPDGSFAINGIPVNAKGQITFAAPRGYVAQIEWKSLPPSCDTAPNLVNINQLAPATYDGVQVRLLKEAVVQGTMRDEQGAPFVKADVIVDQTHYVYFTDAQGRFSAPIPPLTDATLSLSDAPFYEYGPTVGPIWAGEGEVVHKDLVVRRKQPPQHDNDLTGRVVDAQGNAVSGARVYLANYGILPLEIVQHEWARAGAKSLKWQGGMFFPATTTCDKNGNFTFNLLRNGKTDVFADKEGVQWAWVRDVDTGTKDLKLTLEPKPDDATFSGTISDESGKPAPGARVMLFSGDHYRGPLLAEAKTGAAGEFSIHVSPMPFDKTCVRLICRRDDGSIAWKTLPSCGGSDIRLAFKPLAVMHGRVVNKKGQPVKAAQVWCDLERDPDWGELELFHKTLEVSPSATTDGEGRFALHGLPAGSEATLFASHPDYERGELWYVPHIGPDTVVKDIELPDGISVEGTVRFADGKAAPGVTVAVLEEITHDPIAPTKTDAHGRYRLTGLSHTMFLRKPTPIRATSSDEQWEATLDYPNSLLSGDHVTGAEIVLTRSFAWSHRDWLGHPGKAIQSKYRAAVIDDVDPALEGKKTYHESLTVYEGDGKIAWQKNDLAVSYGGGVAVQNPADGLLWVHQNQVKHMVAYTSDGQVAWQHDAPNISAMAADAATASVWCATYSGTIYGNGIQVFDRDGKPVRQLKAAGAVLAYSPPDKCFWVVGRRAQKLDADGKIIAECPQSFAWIARVVAVNPNDGSVWLVEAKHPEVYGSLNRILILSPDGQIRKEINLENAYVLSLALDPARGVAWAQAPQSVRKISFEGQTLAEIPVKGQVCLEPDTGCVWVAGRSGVWRLDPDGRLLWAHESRVETDKHVAVLMK